LSSSEPNRLIDASSNGDQWQLLLDLATGHSFVRHTGNLASGGDLTEFSLAPFSIRSERA
jgi:hypothetical protein